VFHENSKHIEIIYHYICDMAQRGVMDSIIFILMSRLQTYSPRLCPERSFGLQREAWTDVCDPPD